MGYPVGTSLVEDDKIDLARKLIDLAGDKLVLPTGAVIAERLAPDVPTRSVPRDGISSGWAMFDIDDATERLFARSIGKAGTVVWNGPMGVFETPPFNHGTVAVAHAMADATDAGAVTVVGGGDSAAAVAEAGLSDRMTHVSTGGGASMEFLEGRILPGVSALDDANDD
jgi:phosphoglycerate kinase